MFSTFFFFFFFFLFAFFLRSSSTERGCYLIGLPILEKTPALRPKSNGRDSLMFLVRGGMILRPISALCFLQMCIYPTTVVAPGGTSVWWYRWMPRCCCCIMYARVVFSCPAHYFSFFFFSRFLFLVFADANRSVRWDGMVWDVFLI